MHTPHFDTDELIQKFVAQGTPEAQARTFVRGIVESQYELATKQDIKDLEASLKSEIKILSLQIKALFALNAGIIAAIVWFGQTLLTKIT